MLRRLMNAPDKPPRKTTRGEISFHTRPQSLLETQAPGPDRPGFPGRLCHCPAWRPHMTYCSFLSLELSPLQNGTVMLIN